MPTPSSSQYGNVDGPSSSTDNAIVRFDGTTGKLIQNSVLIVSDVGDLAMPSTATAGLQLYNTADQTTNYERLEALWSGNAAIIRTVKGGSGTNRNLILGASSGIVSIAASSVLRLDNGVAATPAISFLNNSGAGFYLINNYSLGLVTGSNTQTSGTFTPLSITPTYNQASGTAANTDLAITRTETAVGSGAQNFITAGTAALGTLFSVSNRGSVAVGGATASASTALMTPAGTTAISSIRIPHGAAPTSPVDGDMWTTTAGLFIRINGATVGPLS